MAMNDPHSRFSPTTTYAGHTRQHDYTITVHHSPWRTKVMALSIDGIEQLHSESSPPPTDQADAESPRSESPVGPSSAEVAQQNVEVRVHGWLTVRIIVRRPTVKGTMVDREEIHVSTAALGGAGEAEVHKDDTITPLLPEAGSKSEQRDFKRTANPTAYALIAGLTTALRLCIPLLGLGALLSFLTEPVKAWLSRHVAPIVDPIFEWLGRLFEPVGRALTTVGHFLGRIIDFLFGWIPEVHMPFDVPDWAWTVAKVALFALIAFSVNKSNLNRKKKQLEQAEDNASDKAE